MRFQQAYRNTSKAIENVRLLSPSGERVSLAQLTKVEVKDGAYDIYREQNSRYVAITFNVRGRDLGSTVEQAIKAINRNVKMPPGYRVDFSGEYESEKRAEARLRIIVPLTLLVIFIILYTMFRSFKWAALILFNVAFAPFGGLLALMLTGTYLSVSSGVPSMLALAEASRSRPESSWSNTSTSSRRRARSIMDSRGRRRGLETSPHR